MKTSTSKYFILFGTVGFAIACSTKKDSFVNRNYHAVTTEYNVLYNGNLALDAGIADVTATYQDNFWDILPVERMQPVTAPPAVAKTSQVEAPSATSQKGAKDTKAQQTVKGTKSLSEQMPAELSLMGKSNSAKNSLGKGADAGKVSAAADGPAPGQTANFKRAEEKATKAIQKHSMNIGGTERNPQMDEAHLLLGKSRYYENRFLPALEAFNYILLKYPSSDKIDEAKIWREKTNIRLDNEAIAVRNLKELIKQKRESMDEQTFADANAILAEGYLHMQAYDSAVTVLKNSAQFTTKNEQRARYHFILGQLQSKLNRPDSAYAEYQRVIDMKRKSPRRYVIQAHAMQAGQYNYAKGDSLAFMNKYWDLLEDRENRPYLDIINHQVGIFFDKQKDNERAIEFYNRSLDQNSQDRYLTASNYRNIAEIKFREAKYPSAGMYYDSTMIYLDNRGREHRSIKKKRDNLNDVIKYEAIAHANDSILNLLSLDDAGRKAYFEKHIEKLKQEDAAEKERLQKEANKQENLAAGAASRSFTQNGAGSNMKETFGTPQGTSPGGKFYFYTAATVAYGKQEFKRRWGNRAYSENWRWSAEQMNKGATNVEETEQVAEIDPNAPKDSDGKPIEPRFRTDFYTSQLPTDKKVIDSLSTERNFAYYQLGSIYKEKFKEYKLAADKLETLLQSNPEERLVLPSKYNLYKIYEIIDPAKAEIYKQQILSQYPDSRYAEIIKNPSSDMSKTLAPDAAYDAVFKRYNQGEIREVYAQIDEYIDTYTGEDIVSKFELLKARIGARLMGIEEYKKGLNYVALNYPNVIEGKESEAILKNDIPNLEKLTFGQPTASWKIVYKFDIADEAKIKPLKEKIEKFIKEGLNNNIILTSDVYTLKENMLVLHGFISKLAAEDAVSVLKDYKKYKVAEPLEVISTEDYKVVQIKKNYTEFLAIE